MQLVDRINFLNILLMCVAFALAMIAPVELFVVAYSLLGPLHYLTELSWLHDRKLFVSDAKAYKPLWMLAAIWTVLFMANFLFAPAGGVKILVHLAAISVIAALGIAILLMSGRQATGRAIACIIAVSAVVETLPGATLAFGVFLTTIVHVFFFTMIFMLSGAIKDGRRSSYVAVACLLTLAATLLVWTPSISYLPASEWVDRLKVFGRLDLIIAKFVGWKEPSQIIAIMRFIAFAYTYHYFNWFSKTSIIRWHEVPRKRVVVLAAIYALSIAAYVINYQLGFSITLLMSIGHVFLEFPLDLKATSMVCNSLSEMLRQRLLRSEATT